MAQKKAELFSFLENPICLIKIYLVDPLEGFKESHSDLKNGQNWKKWANLGNQQFFGEIAR